MCPPILASITSGPSVPLLVVSEGNIGMDLSLAACLLAPILRSAFLTAYTQLYTDADSAGDKGDRRSTSGYLTLVGGNLVTWRSKKQKVVALSSVEAKFRGIARGITEVLWIRKLLTEIGYPPQEPSKVMSDNKAAI
ncbi:putative ribonuclease H-like domain-containing protein [Tanacetum coccineum]